MHSTFKCEYCDTSTQHSLESFQIDVVARLLGRVFKVLLEDVPKKQANDRKRINIHRGSRKRQRIKRLRKKSDPLDSEFIN